MKLIINNRKDITDLHNKHFHLYLLNKCQAQNFII